MKKVINNAAVPKGGKFIYVNAEDGYTLTHPYFNQLRTFVLDYRRLNNYPIGLQFDDQFEAEVCKNAHETTCEEYAEPGPFQKVAKLTIALVKAAKNGFKVVSTDEFNRRMAICSQCNFFRGNNGILKVSCGKCGCNSLKAYLQSESCPISKWS